MAVKLDEKSCPGDLYVNDLLGVYMLESFYSGPSATIQHAYSGEKKGGAIGSNNLENYRPISLLTKDELIGHIKKLVLNMGAKREEIDKLKREVKQLKHEARETYIKQLEARETYIKQLEAKVNQGR